MRYTILYLAIAIAVFLAVGCDKSDRKLMAPPDIEQPTPQG
jgi:hypothetical protein